jgi:hypothetical protein
MADAEDSLAALLRAIEADGDLPACEAAVARGFASFVDSEALWAFPDEVLFAILARADVRYPGPDATARFFARLFARGDRAARLFGALLPYDSLSAAACEALAAQFNALGRPADARRLRRIGALHARLERPRPGARERAQQTAQALEQTTARLREASAALRQATELLGRRDADLRARGEIIARLTAHRPGKR